MDIRLYILIINILLIIRDKLIMIFWNLINKKLFVYL